MYMDKLILFGAGEQGKNWLKRIVKDNIWACADSDIKKNGREFCGKRVISVEELK